MERFRKARYRILVAAACAGLLIPALAAQTNSSAPNPSQLYVHRADCHIAYDFLIEEIDNNRSVSGEDEAWARAHEAAGNEGRPCIAPSGELALKAQDRVIATSDGARAARSYIDKQADPVAMLELGLSFYSGFFSDATQQDGARLIKTAADKGDPMANYLYGMFLAQGLNGTRDYTAALPYLERGAASGNIDALFRYGIFLKEGLGARKDAKKAFGQFSRAAENGHAYAAVVAFDMLTNGEGTKKDMALAYRLGRNLAGQGEVYGAIMAAAALLQSKDATKHRDEILYWADHAIRYGDDTIKSQMSPVRTQIVDLFDRIDAPPPAYSPEPRKVCPQKTVCTVNHFTGLQTCTSGKDYWSDCDG
jgi:uncharacterized protein